MGLGKSGERARLEDPRFEDRLEVHTSDQVEYRYLLIPTFMERLVALDDRFDGKLQAAFDEDRFLLSYDPTTAGSKQRGNPQTCGTPPPLLIWSVMSPCCLTWLTS